MTAPMIALTTASVVLLSYQATYHWFCF